MSVSLLILRVGDQFFGVDVSFTRSVILPVATTPVPGAPAHIAGVANIDGTIIAVLDVGVRLGIAHDLTSEGRLCLVDSPSGPTALLVDDALEVVSVSEEEVEPGPPSPWVVGACRTQLTHLREEPLEAVILVLQPDLLWEVAA